MKARRNKQTEEEIDAIVIAQANDENEWDQPVQLHKKKSASVSLPAALAERAVFFSRVTGKKTWKTGSHGLFRNDWILKRLRSPA